MQCYIKCFLYTVPIDASSRSYTPTLTFDPHFAIDGIISDQYYFKSAPESHPFLAIDLGNTLTVVQVVLTFPSGQPEDLTQIEVRVGSVGSLTRDRRLVDNDICGQVSR